MNCLNCNQPLEDCQCEVSSAEKEYARQPEILAGIKRGVADVRPWMEIKNEIEELSEIANQAVIKPEPVSYQLTKQTIKRIESMMSPNHIVEIAIEDGKLQLSLRPKQTDEIRIHPVCPCMDEDSQVHFYATKLGEPQVYLAQVKIPAGTWITGLKVARNEV